MGIYTPHADRDFDDRISSDMGILINKITSDLSDVRSIYLCGGFGRGEGSALKKNNFVQPINDYDLVVFTGNKHQKFNLIKFRHELSELCKIRQVDLSVIHYKSIRKLKFSMHNYDLVNASKLVYGSDEDELKKIFWEPSKLPLKEGITPLFLFLSSILKPFPIKDKHTDEEIFWSYHQICKSILGWSTAQLVFKNKYDASYAVRNKLYKEQFFYDPESCSLVNKATSFKLTPNLQPCNERELLEFWNLAKSKHLEVLISLVSSFYGSKKLNVNSLSEKHLKSPTSIIKKLLSKVLKRHHYFDCLNIDMAKLFLLSSIENNNDKFYLEESLRYLKKIKGTRICLEEYNSVDDLNEVILSADPNSVSFLSKENTIFYD